MSTTYFPHRLNWDLKMDPRLREDDHRDGRLCVLCERFLPPIHCTSTLIQTLCESLAVECLRLRMPL